MSRRVARRMPKTGSASASTAFRGGCSWAPSTTTAKRFSTPFAVAGAAARAGCAISPVRPGFAQAAVGMFDRWEPPRAPLYSSARNLGARAPRGGGRRGHGRREERGDDPRGGKAQGRGGGTGARGRGRGGPGAARVAAGGGGPLEASPRPGRVAHLAPAACRDPRGQPHGTRAHPHRRRAGGGGGLFLAPAREDPRAPRRRDKGGEAAHLRRAGESGRGAAHRPGGRRAGFAPARGALVLLR